MSNTYRCVLILADDGYYGQDRKVTRFFKRVDRRVERRNHKRITALAVSEAYADMEYDAHEEMLADLDDWDQYDFPMDEPEDDFYGYGPYDPFDYYFWDDQYD